MDERTLHEEQQNVNRVQKLIDDEVETLDSFIHDMANQNLDALKYVQSENLDLLEMAEAYSDINTRDERLYDVTSKRLFLKRIRPKPFFARLVFDNENGKQEDLFVGLKNIDRDGNPYVIDWRVPVASLLYFSSLGKTSYTAPLGEVSVDLKLKRQYRISDGILNSYVDTNVKIDDEVLQEVLSKNTSSYMSNIVQSIQAEQNAIIRKEPYCSVIINGIAGSGKTSIAMHRISYVLYALKGTITSRNIRIISPNPMFSEYISKLLPELGEENVETESILSFMRTFDAIPIKMDASRKEMVEQCFSDPLRQDMVNYKFSTEFYHKVEEYLDNLDMKKMIKTINFDNMKFTDEAIDEAVKVAGKVPNVYSKFIKICSKLISDYDPYATGKTMDKQMQKIKIRAKTAFKTMDIMREMYSHFGMTLPAKLKYEDIPIYAFIEHKTRMLQPNYFIKHVFIDEVQDYDPFSLRLLKDLYPLAVFTAVGDYNQNLLSTQTNLPTLKELLPKADVDKLDTSYRSSYEIVEFSAKVMGGTIEINLVRHGEKPIVKKCTKNELNEHIKNIVENHKDSKIAVIVKTDKEAKKYADMLEDFTLIIDENDKNLLTKNLIITTVYLSKGLEYDHVILPNLDRDVYNTTLDRQNLYVATTRALHGLYGFYENEVSKFVPLENLE
ncbi:MAG: hypothetical protein E7374_00555 [Clostridiales bacterium]|nr:hypothetical protein [Clostridiales bacterium]